MNSVVHTYRTVKMEQTQRSETLAFKLLSPGNHPKDSLQHSEYGERLKSCKCHVAQTNYVTVQTRGATVMRFRNLNNIYPEIIN
jgi:hypothetical protein